MALPRKSRYIGNGFYSRYMGEEVYSNGGYWVEKSAEYNQLNGKIIPGSIIFTLYDMDDDPGEVFKTLKEAKAYIKKIS